MEIKRAVAGAAIGAFLLLGVAGCGGGHDSARSLGEAMVDAFNDKDTDALVDLACEADQKAAENFNLEAVMGAAAQKDYEVSLVDAVEEGDKGTVTLKLTVDGKSQNEDFPVVKEDGDWVICAGG